MRRLQALAGVLSLGGAVYLFVAGTTRPGVVAAPASPSLTISPAAHDFGDILSQNELSAQFTITNTYAEPAEVVQVMKGCACSDAVLEPPTIPANGTSTLAVRWRMAGKQGRVSEGVVLVCRVGERTEYLRARLVARVVLPVEADRELVELDPGGRPERVGYHTRDGRPFVLAAATPNHPCLKAAIGPDSRSVAIHYDPSEPGAGSGQLYVTITTDLVEVPSTRLNVFVNR